MKKGDTSMNLIFNRVIAFLIDLSLSVLTGSLSFFLAFKTVFSSIDIKILIAIYHFFMTSIFYVVTNGSSLGQFLLRIQIKNQNNKNASKSTLIVRNLIFCIIYFGSFYNILILIIFLLSCVGIFLKDHRNTGWDIIMRTKVEKM